MKEMMVKLINYFHKSPYIKDISTTFLTRVLTFILGVVISIIIARVLGPQGKGFYTLYLMILSLPIQILSLGVSVSVIYFLGKRIYSKDVIFKSVVVLSFAVGVIIGIILLLSSSFIKTNIIKNDLFFYKTLIIISLLAPLWILWNYLLSIYRGLNNFKKYNFLVLFNKFLYLLFILVVLIFAATTSHCSILCALLVAYIVSIIWGIIWLKPNVNFFKINFIQPLKNLIYFNLKGHLGTIIQFFNYRLDIFLIGYFLTAKEVGYYSIGVGIAELLWYLPNAVSIVLLSRTALANNRKEINLRTSKTVSFVFWTMILSCLVIFLLGKYIIGLMYGKNFLPAVGPLKWLLPGIISLSIWKVLCNDLAGRGLPQYKFYSSLPSFFITVLLNIILIPKLGIIGAAITTSIAYFISTVIIICIYTRISGTRKKELFIPRYSFYLRER